MTTLADDTLTLSGPFTLATVSAFIDNGKALAAKGNLQVDFSAVTAADSAVLAALFAWIREARLHQHEVSVRNLPAGARSLAKLYGVDALLPTSA